ncbi:DUF3324 domain-containing protein [Pediococcus acidilactici]|nr:DUF3324 domain-containing protein [Pediococcus acidilactici]UWF32980.1 DUF916 and DUF3324 domain-containing protein [Pediococcus acidilactici]
MHHLNPLKQNPKRYFLRFVLVYVCSVLLALVFSGTINANAKSNNRVTFDAKAILPKNQQSDASYYDLRVRPGANETLFIKLRNLTSEKQTIIIKTNNAVTNQNGAIDYSKSKAKLLGEPAFKQMISGPQTVTLKPKESRKVDYRLKIPAKGFEGTVLGGFYCYAKPTKTSTKQQSLSLINNFAYTIGAKLRCSNNKVQPKLSLKKAIPGLENGYLTVFATLQNSAPTLLSKLDMRATVTKAGHQKVLKETNKQISIAPRSRFRLPISWDNQPLKSGRYVLKIVLKSATGKKWQLSKEFTITGADTKLNQKAVELKKLANNLLIYLIMGLLIGVILLLSGYIYRMKRKDNKTEK